MHKFVVAIIAMTLISTAGWTQSTTDEVFNDLGSGKVATIMGAMRTIEGDAQLKNNVISEINKGLSQNSILQKLIPKGRIKIEMQAADGTTEYAYVIIGKDGLLKDLGPGIVDRWAYSVTLTEAFLDKMGQSDNPPEALVSALRNKEIEIRAKSIGGKIKIIFLKLGARIAALFGGK